MNRHKYKLYLSWVLASVCGTFWSGVSAQNVSSSDYPDCTGYAPYIQDGHCDEINNVADCGWDGGDCCPCTCLDDLEHDCGVLTDFDCVDPDVPDECGATPSPAAAFGFPDCTGYMYDLEDGNCDEDLNNEECGYDGGDCCRCTCTDDSGWECDRGSFDCKDPEAPDDCETASPTPSPAASYGYPDCTGTMYLHQNGYCSDDLNNEECGYDGGDCCRCTCRTLSTYDSYTRCSGSFECKDPEAPLDCPTPSPTPSPAASYGYPDCEGYLYDFQNGNCDYDLNNAECGFDGGDCCTCTCQSSSYTCGTYYNCLDPDAECVDSTSAQTTDDDTSVCSDPSRRGNGYCSYDLNTEACEYDGGDCCECTCSETSEIACGVNGYNCLDPDACSSTTSSGSKTLEADSSSDPSPFISDQLFPTGLIVVIALFGAGMCFIVLQFTNICRACKIDARYTGRRSSPPPVVPEAPQPGRPHGAEALSYNAWGESAPPSAPGQGTSAWYRRLWPGSSSRQFNTATGPSPPQRVSAPLAPPQPSAPSVLPRPSAPQVLHQPVSAASRPIAHARSIAARQQTAPRTPVFGAAPDGVLQGQPDTRNASESDTNMIVTSYQEGRCLAALDENERVQMAIEESRKVKTIAEAMYHQERDIAGIAKALSEDEGAAVESQHANGISGGEPKSDEADEPTDVSVADISDDSESEWGDDEDRKVEAEPSPPRSAPLVAESGGGDDSGKKSTRTAEAGNNSEAEEETQVSQTTRELDGLSMEHGKQVEASSEGAEGSQNDDTASEPTDTVGKLASLERGNGVPADLDEEIAQEGASSGDWNGERSRSESGGSEHGTSCDQSAEGGSETTSERALEHKAADVSDEVVKEGMDTAPPGVGIEGGVTGHGEAKGEEVSRNESELGAAEAEPEIDEIAANEGTIGAGLLSQPPASEGEVSEGSPTPTEDGESPTTRSRKSPMSFEEDDSEGKEGNVDDSENDPQGARLRTE